MCALDQVNVNMFVYVCVFVCLSHDVVGWLRDGFTRNARHNMLTDSKRRQRAVRLRKNNKLAHRITLALPLSLHPTSSYLYSPITKGLRARPTFTHTYKAYSHSWIEANTTANMLYILPTTTSLHAFPCAISRKKAASSMLVYRAIPHRDVCGAPPSICPS